MSNTFDKKLVESLELKELSEREEIVAIVAEQQQMEQEGFTPFDWTIII
ncbi:hypothetical protein HMPREF0645_0610 [Hallella bergensis DSM 17361]|uniref:Uncharacterized protein n=1 Tax=Hallella bergensis DSM 17361 TaxID=585502 RepID=D1PUH5_9BACT|nr:hypothetical protein [Hallella bergensis]EFA44983.1 hypothetical protein HMPREF0645_0610 [Hallella bergensis DSM 17361]